MMMPPRAARGRSTMAAWTTRTWEGSPKIVSVTGTGYDAEAS
jgi:hypothetical protein